jgi:hypothetical protein
MKFLRTAIMALFISTAFIACKKDHDDVKPSFSIEGSWVGKIGSGANAPSGQYALNIKAGGVIQRIGNNGSVSASGTWQLAGNNFTATYNYSNGTVVNITGTVDKTINKLTATWTNSGGEEGTLYANKQ